MKTMKLHMGAALLGASLLTTPLLAQSGNQYDRNQDRVATHNTAQNVPARLVRGETLLGADIVNMNNESIGEIDDLIVDAKTKRVKFAIATIDTEGFGGRTIAMPFSALGWNDYTDSWTTTVPMSTFERLTEFDDDNWEVLYDQGWASTLAGYWDAGERRQWEQHVKTGYDRDGRTYGTPDHFTKSFRRGTKMHIDGEVVKVMTWSPDDSDAVYKVAKIRDRTSDNERTVILANERYLKDVTLPRQGETVKVYGARHISDTNRNVYIARSLNTNNGTIFFRDADGRPSAGVRAANTTDRDDDMLHDPLPKTALVLASELDGRSIFANNEKCGSIDNAVIDARTGMMRFLITSIGGWMDIGDSTIVIPIEAGQFDRNLDFHTSVGKSTLINAPTLQQDADRALAQMAFVDNTYRYFNIDESKRAKAPKRAANTWDRSGGWDADSPYQGKLRNAEDANMKVVIYDVYQSRPTNDMVDGALVLAKGPQGKMYDVHVGPRWFVERQNIDFEPGSDMEVEGWLVRDQGRVYLVPKKFVLASGDALTLRDDNGHPVWDTRSN